MSNFAGFTPFLRHLRKKLAVMQNRLIGLLLHGRPVGGAGAAGYRYRAEACRLGLFNARKRAEKTTVSSFRACRRFIARSNIVPL